MTEEMQKNNNTNENTQTEQAPAPEVATAPAAVSSAPKTTQQPSSMQNMFVGVVGVLVIMAGIQVFQTQQLMAAVSSGAIKATGQTQQDTGIGLQSQVGGCG